MKGYKLEDAGKEFQMTHQILKAQRFGTAECHIQTFWTAVERKHFSCVWILLLIAEGIRLSGWSSERWVRMDLGCVRQERVDKRDAYSVEEVKVGIETEDKQMRLWS